MMNTPAEAAKSASSGVCSQGRSIQLSAASRAILSVLAIQTSVLRCTGRRMLGIMCVLGLGFSTLASSQPASHGEHQAADITGIAARTATSPHNDAVLTAPPGEIDLLFPEAVRLVKLTLRNEQRDWVDIEFRYDPQLAQEFNWDLPSLDPSIYYTVEWAALDRFERLVRGSFDFAFGPDAKLPSVVKQAEEQVLQQRYGDPSIQYVQPPPTQIIIDRDPPRYDPPFVIDLDDPEDPDNP